MTPKRIQLKRTKGWRLPPNTVVVARPSRWGNPWRVGVDGTAEYCVQRYRNFVTGNLWSFPTPEVIRENLAGLNLACWCPLDQPCHADVLLELANK